MGRLGSPDTIVSMAARQSNGGRAVMMARGLRYHVHSVMNRRELLKLGASVAAAPAAGIAQQHEHPASGAAPKPTAEWKAELFDEHENQTVIALVDLIIPATDTPGAKAAVVNRHMDHILAAAPEDEKTRFREGLWWIDGYAMRKYSKPFTGCNTPEQTAILQTLDQGKDPD